MKQAEFLGNIGNLAIYESNGVGKSGNAKGVSKSIQVRYYSADDSYMLKKSFSFNLADPEARGRALQKARNFAQQNQPA